MNPSGLPGPGTELSAEARLVVKADAKYLEGGRILCGADSRDPLNADNHEVLRAGIILGMNSSTKKLAPAVIGLVVTDTATDSKSLVVTEATGDEVERRCGAAGSIKLVGPPTDTGTVAVSADLPYTSIDAESGGNRIINLTSNAPAVYVDGSWVCDIDGTHIPMSLIDTPCGVKVTNDANSSIDVECRPVISGQIDTSELINFPAAALTTLRVWVKAYLRATGLGFMFDDDWGI
jgi:hypothetical protein